jgi:hypothetical protein
MRRRGTRFTVTWVFSGRLYEPATARHVIALKYARSRASTGGVGHDEEQRGCDLAGFRPKLHDNIDHGWKAWLHRNVDLVGDPGALGIPQSGWPPSSALHRRREWGDQGCTDECAEDRSHVAARSCAEEVSAVWRQRRLR